MKELIPAGEVVEKGIVKGVKVEIYGGFEPGDILSVGEEQGITKEEFHSILDKASQPINKKEENDDEK